MFASVEEAQHGLEARRAKHPQYQPDLEAAENKWAPQLTELRKNGYIVLREFLPHAKALEIGRTFDAFCKEGKSLQLSRNLDNVTDNMDWKQSNRFSADDMKKGEEWLKDRTNIMQVDQPLIQFPELAQMALDPVLLDLAGTYLGALPLMSFAKIRKSFANKLPLFDTELWHIDGNSRSMMKALLYLSDIEHDTGPHEFVAGTHTKTAEINADGRWSRDDMMRMFGKDSIHSITGKAGDLILEDTTGFHCAARPQRGDRKIAIFNYVLHPEYGYEAVN
ncbi:MAG TPA: phytanoyl-CoA dioxygenase family protein, partial [Alphaproteobacteria bacterium]|nr:phytanoyl-CoA dioxygenase family protein [Alphaproteobacteria bacterium]